MRERVILPDRTTGASSSSSDFSAWVSESVTSNSHCGGSAPSRYMGFGGVFSLSTLLNNDHSVSIRIIWRIIFKEDIKIIPWWYRDNRGGRSATFLSAFTTSCHFHTHDFNRWWLFYCIWFFTFSTMWFLACSVLLQIELWYILLFFAFHLIALHIF